MCDRRIQWPVSDRLPFDPAKLQPRVRTDSATPLTVSQLAARIDGALKQGIPDAVRVVGEVSGFRERTHWYFDLKDGTSVINCVMFASAAKRAGFTPAVGQQVIAKGRIDFYAPGGKVSFVLESLEPAGAGALELQLRKLLEEVKALGWTDPERKRPLPFFPRKIAVITSKSGAALQDVLVTMQRRCPAVDVLLVDARMQGEAAVPEIVASITHVSRHHARLGVDALLVTRGGGSMEDLWCFNDRRVAQAIVECEVPVVAAIGHETDTTIAELVADERCATPTQAAMRLTPDRDALGQQIDAEQARLWLLMHRRIESLSKHVALLARTPIFSSPAEHFAGAAEQVTHAERHLASAVRARLMSARQDVAQHATRMERARPTAVMAQLREKLRSAEREIARAMHARMARDQAALSSLQRTLDAVSPQRVLERGFSVTLRADGRVVRRPQDVQPGDELVTRLAEGQVASRVSGSREAPRLSARKKRSEGGPSLFDA